MVWQSASDTGKRVEIEAVSLEEAREKLEAEYGRGTVFDLHNELDASKPRQPDKS
jgi:hypothetical protein